MVSVSGKMVRTSDFTMPIAKFFGRNPGKPLKIFGEVGGIEKELPCHPGNGLWRKQELFGEFDKFVLVQVAGRLLQYFVDRVAQVGRMDVQQLGKILNFKSAFRSACAQVVHVPIQLLEVVPHNFFLTGRDFGSDRSDHRCKGTRP